MPRGLNANGATEFDTNVRASNNADPRQASPDAGIDDASVEARTYPDDFVPSDVDIKNALWRIATGEGSETSKVSALRVLADIMGLMRQDQPDFPEGMAALLDALARGLDPAHSD